MKKIYFLLLTLLVNTALWADPHDCISKIEAEALIERLLEERYLVNFCDCCYDLSGSSVEAKLIYVKSAKIINCYYDSERVSVRMETEVLGSYKILDQNYAESMDFEPVNEWTAILNYQFFLDKGKIRHLGFAIKEDYEPPSCSGLKGFPSAKLVKKKTYKSWLKKQK